MTTRKQTPHLWPRRRPGIIALIRSIRPHWSRILWWYSSVSWMSNLLKISSNIESNFRNGFFQHISHRFERWIEFLGPVLAKLTKNSFDAAVVIKKTQRRFPPFIVRRAGLLLSQQDFEWRWSVPLFQCLTVLEFSFILFDLCLLITFFNFIMNYVLIVTFWIFTYHKIWILSIMFCFIWSYWIIYFFSMFVSVLESCELTGVCLLLQWLIKWK